MPTFRFADGSTRDLAIEPDDDQLAVLGLDADGYVVVRHTDGAFVMDYALTACCQASAKGCDGYIGCRACYAEVDPKLGGDPDPITHPVLPDPKESPTMTTTTTETAVARPASPAPADSYRRLGLTDESEWTSGMRLAVRQKWTGLPVDAKVDDLRARLAAITTADVPSVADLVAKAFTPDEAEAERARLLRNAKVNAWRERGRLRAALEARELKFAKLRASASKAKVPPLDDDTVEAITDLTTPSS